MIKYVNEVKKDDLAGKKVLLRVNFDLPIVDGRISEDFRVKSHKETVDYLINNGAKVLLVSHLGHDDESASFLLITEQIGEILGHTLTLVPHDHLGTVDILFHKCPVLLLDNIRQDSREIQNDDGFAAELADGFDYYVNDDFATAHRSHASIVAITKHLPSYAGFLIKKEIENLGRAINAPLEGKVLVLGGAKISTKLPIIKNFLDKAEKILIGGAIANDFFDVQGINIGISLVGDALFPDIQSEKIILPQDLLISDDRTGESEPETYPVKDIEPEYAILDIGPETAKKYADIIKQSKMVIWNGPMGVSEIGVFAEGTRRVAKAVVLAAKSIIGGGDTIAAADKLGLLSRYSFVSTGGGAMLEFLAGNRLPGLDVLGYYD